MSAEKPAVTILVIEDDPMMHVILRHGLSGLQDTEVVVAATGQEGIDVATGATPDLVLLDLMLPDMTGVEVIERLRQRQATASVPVIFLTGAARSLDEDMLRRNSVAGVIEKPFDRQTLLREVQSAIRGETTGTTGTLPTIGEIRAAFLSQGAEASGTMIADLDAATLDVPSLRELAHLCAGRGGTLGFPAASEVARRLEAELQREKVDAGALRSALGELHEFFRSRPEPEEAATVPTGHAADGLLHDAVAGGLAGKRVALIGFEGDQGQPLQRALDDVDAFHRRLEEQDVERLDRFDLIVAHLGDDDALSAPGSALAETTRPCILIGHRELLATGALISVRHDFLVTPWNADEVLLRAHLLLMAAPAPAAAKAKAGRDRPLVVIADDDTAITSLIAATLAGGEIDSRIAANGEQALEVIAKHPPDALVLDVNMPGLDGFEVLSRLKSTPTSSALPVLMLTARQRETDVIRGFRLGADDYMIKPFNPTELLARLTRLLRTSQ